MKLTFKYKADLNAYEVEAPQNATFHEILAWLTDDAHYLEPLPPRARYSVVRSGTDYFVDGNQTLADASASDGACFEILMESHGGDPGIVDAAAAWGAAKLTIDAARVAVDAYRVRTERMAAELERRRLDAQDHDQPDPSSAKPQSDCVSSADPPRRPRLSLSSLWRCAQGRSQATRWRSRHGSRFRARRSRRQAVR